MRKNACISEATWIPVDKRFFALQDPAKDQSLIGRLGHAISASLKGNKRQQAEEAGAGAEVETLLGLEPPLHREAWHRLKECYWSNFYCATPPNWFTLEQITAEQVDLYSYVPPPGANIPIYVEPFPVDDLVPTEDKIEWAVKRL